MPEVDVTQASGDRGADALAARLHRHGVAVTPQRLEIARVLLNRAQHLSAEQILEKLGERNAEVSKATVYNTLGLFARAGLIREVFADPSRVFYDSNIADHFHFYNVDTGALSDIERDDVRLTRLPALPAGTELSGVDIIIRVRRVPSE